MREEDSTKCTTGDSGYGHEDASWGGELIDLKRKLSSLLLLCQIDIILLQFLDFVYSSF